MLKSCRIAFIAQNKAKKYDIYLLSNAIQTYASASLSVILSAAAYIVRRFPEFPHPIQTKSKLPHKRMDPEYPSPYLSLHPLFDEWVDILSQTFFSKNAFRVGQILYLKVNISQQFGEILKKTDLTHIESNTNASIHQIFKIDNEHGFSNKKIGWINCSTSQYNKKMFQPAINSIGIMLGQMYNNEQYTLFNILKNNIPSVEDLLQFDTLIIPGSGLSVLSHVQPVEQVAKNIRQAYVKSDKLKILGICYGHQLMAQIFGAKVVKRQRYGGIQLVQFDKQVINKFQFLSCLKKYEQPKLSLSQHHEDFVTTTPEQYYRLAVSNSCQNEALVSKNGRIFSVQFHPEYIYHFTKGYVARLNTYYNDKIADRPKYSHNADILQQHIKHSLDIRECICKFI